MSERVLDAAAQYGLLGLTLLAIFSAFAFASRWVATNILKPMVEAHIEERRKVGEANVETQRQTTVFMQAMQTHAASEERTMAEISATQKENAANQRAIIETQRDVLRAIAELSRK